MILGLDVSTSVIGYTILNNDGSFVDIGYIDLKKLDDLYDKMNLFRDFLLLTKNKYNVEKIFVEEPLMAFGKGLSMASTLSKLQRFNGMVCSCIYFNLDVKPVLINASHSRKICGIKTKKGEKTKQVVLDYVKSLNIIPQNKWEHKRSGKDKETNGDMSDSFVIAVAGLKENE